MELGGNVVERKQRGQHSQLGRDALDLQLLSLSPRSRSIGKDQKMQDNGMHDLSMFATDEFVVEDLPETGALGSFGSVGCFGSSVGSCASSVSTGSTFS